jgi:Ion channel
MDDFGPETWVARLNIRDESALTQYIASYYWSMQTLTTVGYGDIPPYTDPERIICVLWMMTGVFFYSFTIGNLSNIIGNIDKTSEYIKTRLSSFNAFSLKVKLPEFMRQKVQRFFEYHFLLSSKRQN